MSKMLTFGLREEIGCNKTITFFFYGKCTRLYRICQSTASAGYPSLRVKGSSDAPCGCPLWVSRVAQLRPSASKNGTPTRGVATGTLKDGEPGRNYLDSAGIFML